uniref:Uncharacterized protein n=1 Tax=Anguilla anguilla TaxID=7936 RepID=A0A0E9W8Z7_ANGAN
MNNSTKNILCINRASETARRLHFTWTHCDQNGCSG